MPGLKRQRQPSSSYTAASSTAPDRRVCTAVLKKDGYDVSIDQNPTLNLAGDVAATRPIIAQSKNPVVLVGHSYAGVVITGAGNDLKVSKLVYIAAFAPDKGEFVASLIKEPASDDPACSSALHVGTPAPR